MKTEENGQSSRHEGLRAGARAVPFRCFGVFSSCFLPILKNEMKHEKTSKLKRLREKTRE